MTNLVDKKCISTEDLAAARKFLMKLRRQVENPWHKATLKSVVMMLHPKTNPKLQLPKRGRPTTIRPPKRCESCKGLFFKPKKRSARDWKKQKFCSEKCRIKGKQVACATCGTSFRRRRCDNKYCSRECYWKSPTSWKNRPATRSYWDVFDELAEYL